MQVSELSPIHDIIRDLSRWKLADLFSIRLLIFRVAKYFGKKPLYHFKILLNDYFPRLLCLLE